MKSFWNIPCVLVALLAGCSKPENAAPRPTHYVAPIQLHVPALTNWVRSNDIATGDFAKGGLMMRLEPSQKVPGSPRLDVWWEPVRTVPTRLQEYLTRNLREMGSHERNGLLRINEVSQRPVKIGPRKAYRVRHEYIVGKDRKQIAITQISTLTVLDGRGITVTVSGRTELLHPLGPDIDQMLDGLELGAQSVQTKPNKVNVRSAPKSWKLPSDLTKPIDLGAIGTESDTPGDTGAAPRLAPEVGATERP